MSARSTRRCLRPGGPLEPDALPQAVDVDIESLPELLDTFRASRFGIQLKRGPTAATVAWTAPVRESVLQSS